MSAVNMPVNGRAFHSTASLRSYVAGAVLRRVQCQALTFQKYQGLGNDFILVDNRHHPEPLVSPEAAVRVCDRNFGVGGDGVIFALPPTGDTDFTMRIFNSDGSEPEMCGNGIRCLAKFIADVDGVQSTTYRIHTLAGLIVPELLSDGRICVDMGEPVLDGSKVPTSLAPTDGATVVKAPIEVAGKQWTVTAVGMGNPHAAVYASSDGDVKVDEIDLEAVGPLFERHPAFPARTNTEFVEVLDKGHVRMSVWERGAGRTLACGTGACALVVAGVLEGRLDRVCRVDLPGGPLDIEWREANNRVYMTGPAERVFAGSLEV